MVDDQTPPEAPEAPVEDGTTSPAVLTEYPKQFVNEDGTENREALVKGYHKLRHKLDTTRPTEGQRSSPTSLTIQEQKPLADDAPLEDIARAAGLDPTEVLQEFMKREERDGQGSLTPASYNALKTQGMKKGVVDPLLTLLVKDQRATQKKLLSDASGLAGGDEQRNTVLTWAGENLSKEDLAYFKGQSSDIRGFEWLLGKYKNAVGAGDAQPLIAGSGTVAPSGGAFTSQSEMLKAMQDPRYETDKVYIETVNKRINKMDRDVRHGRT